MTSRRFVVSAVRGYRQLGSTGSAPSREKLPLEASVLDSDNCFSPVAVFESGKSFGIKGLLGKARSAEGTIRLAQEHARTLNEREWAWEAEHGIVTELPHGSDRYKRIGCRCAVCRRGHADMVADYRARYGRPRNTW